MFAGAFGRVVTGRSRAARWVCGALAVGAVGGLTGLASGASAAAAGRAVGGRATKPDFSFFAGKTLTLISPSAPGGSNDYLARIMAPLMASYLHCNINIEDNSAGADVAGQDQIASAAPNGLTFGEMIPGSNVGSLALHAPGVSFAMQGVPIIAGSPSTGGMIIAQPNYPIKTMAQLARTKATVPMIEEGTSSTFIEVKAFLTGYHVHAQYLPGYNSGAQVAQGFVRGDAPMAIMGYSALEQLIIGGRARPIVIAAGLAKGTQGYNLMKKVPTFASFAAADPPKTASGRAAVKAAISLVDLPATVFFAPPGTPAPIVAALTAAARSALAQPSAQAAQLQDGLKPGYVDPAQTLTDIKTALAKVPLLTQYLSS